MNAVARSKKHDAGTALVMPSRVVRVSVASANPYQAGQCSSHAPNHGGLGYVNCITSFIVRSI